MTFQLPTDTLQFGVALDTGGSVTAGFTVELFDVNGKSLGVTQVDTQTGQGFTFTDGQFNSPSGVSIKRAVVTFNSQAAGRFAADNITYDVPIP